VHCDVKPGNIMLTRTGAKLLDFGIAQMAGESFTEFLGAGTLPYTAPEQSDGQADSRTDVFALGAVLAEMITGSKAFPQGPHQPPGPLPIPPAAPAPIVRILRTCLEPDPARRWQSAADLARALSWAQDPVAVQPRRRAWIAWSVAAICLIGLVAALLWRKPTRPPTVTFHLEAPNGGQIPANPRFAISPDGRRIVFPALNAAGERLLWMRSLDSAEPRPIQGTSGGMAPFFSPDGRFLGFFRGHDLLIQELGTYQIRVLAENLPGPPQAGSWSQTGQILFSIRNALNRSAIIRVVDAGTGRIQPATQLNDAEDEYWHSIPLFVSGKGHFLYRAESNRQREHGGRVGAIYLSRLGTQERKLILAGANTIAYRSGRLFYLDGDRLFQRGFDVARGEWSGQPVEVLPSTAVAWFALSESGALAYLAKPDIKGHPIWVDRSGRTLGELAAPAGEYTAVEVAPDGERAVVLRRDEQTGDGHLWIVENGSARRFTDGPGESLSPLWSPDGRSIIYSEQLNGKCVIRRKSLQQDSDPETLFEPAGAFAVTGLTPDSRFATGTLLDTHQTTGFDLFLLDFVRRTARPWRVTPRNEAQSRISPDGAWVTFIDSGAGGSDSRLTITRLDDPSRTWQVTKESATEPRWRADGRELFFADQDRMLQSVTMNLRDVVPSFSEPRQLFRLPPSAGDGNKSWAVSPDGQRFLLAGPAQPLQNSVVIVAPLPEK
jgi:Tol biopolymer transport system component